MIRLPASRDAWGTPEFEATLKRELAQIGADALPLQAALARSSHVADRPIEAVVLGAGTDGGAIRIRVGIFYAGVIAGCSCADDPTPINEETEYCVLGIELDPASAEATVTLLED